MRVHVDPDLLRTIGANRCLVRAEPFRSVMTGDYVFDIDAVRTLPGTDTTSSRESMSDRAAVRPDTRTPAQGPPSGARLPSL